MNEQYKYPLYYHLENKTILIYYKNCKKCGNEYDDRIDNLGISKNLCRSCTEASLSYEETKRVLYCCNNKLCKTCYFKSFASNQKSIYLISDINPRMISKNSYEKYDFKCNICDHIFNTSLNNINAGKWCSYCGNRKLCKNLKCKLCFYKSFASNEMVKYWNYEKNKLDPRHLFNKCKTEIYLDCHKCNHTNYIVLNNLRRNTIENLCRFCTKQNGGKRCQEENCIICFNKSFASDWRAVMWNYKLNNNINPKDIPKNDNNFYWFDCNKCNHTFKTTPNYQEAWCPYCGHQKLCDDLYCSFCKPNRFSSIKNSKFWCYEKNIGMDSPEYIFKGSAKKGWFNCHKCNHSFEKVINEISRGKFCPYCESKYLCQSVDCQFCFNKSFASHEKSKYILEKDPRTIFKCSGKKYNFKCNTCQNIFNQSIYNITLGNNWCPFCCNKTESLIYDFLVNLFPDIIRQFKIPSAKNILTGRHYKYDFCIPSKLLIIEVDGEQHFKNMDIWYKKSNDQIEIDVIKMKLAIENNYKIIRISQEDVWKNKIDWKNILLNTINNSSDVIRYISLQPDLYKNHIAKIIF